jgi:hypothetical protein
MIEQRLVKGVNGGVKRKDLGIKKKALESSDNIIKAIKEMLDDFVNER